MRNEIAFRRRSDTCPSIDGEVETTYIEIIARNRKPVVIGSLYKPPNGDNRNFTNILTETVTKIQEGKEVILGMDHNMDLIKCADQKPTQQFLDSLIEITHYKLTNLSKMDYTNSHR